MSKPSVVAAILTAHHPSRYHYRQVARQSFLKDCPIPYKFVFGDAPYEGDWGRTGLRDDEILHAPGSDLKTYLHLKDQAACRWALESGASFLWRAMCDTWWWPERLLKAGLSQFDYAGNWPCTLRLGGAFKVAMPYYDFFHGGTGIWLSRKMMQRIVDVTWREDYLAEWPAQLDVGFGLTAPKLDHPWDDFWISEAIRGELAWDDPLRKDPMASYNAAGITLYEDCQLFVDDNPERAISIHDPGVVKVNTRFNSLERQIRHRNIAQAMRAARVPEAEIKEVPMFDDSIFNPHQAIQRVGNWWEQRKAYRLAALLSLRRREGLPSPVDEQGNPLETRMDNFGNVTYHDADGKQVARVLFAGAGRDGKPGAFAVGQRKGEDIAEAERHWMDSAAPFDILEVAEDGRKLVDEMADLHRDSATYERAERVSHGPAGEQAPGLVLDGTSDEEVDARLQEYLRRGPRMAESADEVDSAC